MNFLPKERRRELIEQQPRQQVREALRDMRRAQRAMDRALAAEPFDAAALAEALARYRENFAAGQEHTHSAFLAMASELTPEERQRLLKSLRRRGGQGKRR